MTSTARKSGAAGPKSPSERMAAYRQRKRAAGLRQVQLWLPDTRSPEFIAKADRQARSIAADDPDEIEIMRWLDQVRDWPTD